jgi:hypothetical protein
MKKIMGRKARVMARPRTMPKTIGRMLGV